MATLIDDGEDICRFCRSEGAPDRPLFHPCICAGSIKYIHQDCLVHWLKYSEKEYCELCNHRFSFTNIYSPDMPKRLPLSVLFMGIFKSSGRLLHRWIHLALVTLAWGVLAPVIACRLYKLFLYEAPPTGIYSHLLELFTTSDIINDIFHGCCIVSCSMVAFISLAWLKEQIVRHGGPDWQEYQDIDAQQDEDDEDESEEEDLAEEHIADEPAIPRSQSHSLASEETNEIANARSIDEDTYFDTSDSIDGTHNYDDTVPRSSNSNAQTVHSPLSILVADKDLSSQSIASPHESSTDWQSSTSQQILAELPLNNMDSSFTPSTDSTGTNPAIYSSATPTRREDLPEPSQSPSPVNDIFPHPNQNHPNGDRAADEGEPQGMEQAEVENDANHNNWNNDWEVNEDISWETMVGLDGSFVYVQHVFWVICLNSLFILLFAFIPYNFGCFIVGLLNLKLYVSMAPFHGFITSVIGYFSVAAVTLIIGALASLAKLRRLARAMNFSYIIIRITIILVFELGLLPLLCGWLLDISTLPLINVTIQERYNHLLTSAYFSTMIHWTVGFAYAFNFLLFICMLKEVVKPKVLSLFYNFEDPTYNPMPEIIRESIWQFIRCFFGISFLMTSSIFLIAYLPVRLVKFALPEFLPYVVTINNELTELTIEFFMLMLIFPTVVDYGNFRSWLATVIKFWCIHVTRYLGLEDYLLNQRVLDSSAIRETTNVARRHSWPLLDNTQPFSTATENQEHDASTILSQEEQLEHTEKNKNRYIVFKIMVLAFLVSLTLIMVGILLVTTPAMIGRVVLGLWFGTKMKIHECNTISIGMFFCFVILRIFTSLYSSLPLSLESIVDQTKRWILITAKATIVIALFGMIPFLIGLIFDVTLIIPRRVGSHQTPIFYLWQDWIFGILLTKAMGVMIMLSPGRMREALEEFYQGGMANIRLELVITRLAGPLIAVLGVYLSLPYIVANLFLPYLGFTEQTIGIVNRDMYGWVMYTGLGIILGSWQFKQLTQLHNNIRNERYMVGRRLVNYLK